MNLRKKFSAALSLFLICLLVMAYTSYAWLTISRAPEVTSIETNVGANGSLEIALLSEETYIDPSGILTSVGDSVLAQDPVVSNLSWGNVIDLTAEKYGLHFVSLRPTRLNVSGGEDFATVGDNMLMTADFGADGRIRFVRAETVSAAFEEDEFIYHSDEQNYGVRAIGTVSGMTSQQVALATARAAVQAYTEAALTAAENAWKENGSAVTDFLYRRFFLNEEFFETTDVEAIHNMALSIQDSLDYVDLAFRQGILGFAASQLQNESDFDDLRSLVNNRSVSLSALIGSVGNSVPASFKDWVFQLDRMSGAVRTLIYNCEHWEQDTQEWTYLLEELLNVLVNPNRAYMGSDQLSTYQAFSEMIEDNVLTLDPASGVLARIAAYAGNYSTFYRWNGTFNIEVRTADDNDPPYLIQLSEILKNLNAVSGDDSKITANLDDIYGYAMDIAFRCNAQSDLLLQTTPTLRVTETSEIPITQGGGSYVRFESEYLDTEQLLHLMDAMRIGFLDNKNTLMAIAKLNTSNYEENEGGVTAPLYLYEYSVTPDGGLSIGERRSEDCTIVPLIQNSPMVITAVVWLDGDYVDNRLVNSMAQSLAGVLNLQFASSADLRHSDLPIKAEG